MRTLGAFILLIFLATCTTYDNAIVYKKNFQPGTHPLLRFNGYYRDIGSVEYGQQSKMKPFFLYANGSALVIERSTEEPAITTWPGISATNSSWGNYKVHADTIYLERFYRNGSNHERIILKGIIQENRIRWVKRKERNNEYQPVDYSVTFMPYASKPDSTQNWIRTKKKYNK